MTLLGICIFSALFGTVMIYRAATGMVAAGAVMASPTKLVVVQLFSMLLGIIAFVVLTVIDADLLADQWKWLCVINVLLLVALVIFPATRAGSASPASASSPRRSSRSSTSSSAPSR